MNEEKTDGEWFDIESSNLEKAQYDPEAKRMLVSFRSGKTYYYDQVSAEEWDEFKGTFGGGASNHFREKFRFWAKGYGLDDG